MHRRLFALLAVVAALLVVAPAASAGHSKDKGSWGWYPGATTLEVDPATLGALTSLGVTPGAVDPASSRERRTRSRSQTRFAARCGAASCATAAASR